MSIYKESELKARENKHLSRLFTNRRNPDLTRLFYALAPTEDARTQQIIDVFQRDGLAKATATIFDAGILTSAASRAELQDRCRAAEEELGFRISFETFGGAFCVARKLMVTGRGRATSHSLTQRGHLTCLFDSVYSIASDDERTLLPDEGDGIFSVKDFNTASGHASQR